MNRRLRVVPDPIIFLVPARSSPAFFPTVCLCCDLHLTIFDVVPSDMRRDVQEIFKVTPHHKQVMMFSATLAKDIRVTCKKFMNNVRQAIYYLYPVLTVILQPLEIFVDDETKLTLHGLQQHYVKLDEVGKNRKLNELLDTLEFNQASCKNHFRLAMIDPLL